MRIGQPCLAHRQARRGNMHLHYGRCVCCVRCGLCQVLPSCVRAHVSSSACAFQTAARCKPFVVAHGTWGSRVGVVVQMAGGRGGGTSSSARSVACILDANRSTLPGAGRVSLTTVALIARARQFLSSARVPRDPCHVLRLRTPRRVGS
jgi:hypothetical protein